MRREQIRIERSIRFKWFHWKALIGFLGFLILFALFYTHRIIKYQEPQFLTFRELKELSRNPYPGWFLERKLQHFWKTPIIDNNAYYHGHGAAGRHPADQKLGKYLRLVSWNIEKSLHMADAITAFSPAKKFEDIIDP